MPRTPEKRTPRLSGALSRHPRRARHINNNGRCCLCHSGSGVAVRVELRPRSCHSRPKERSMRVLRAVAVLAVCLSSTAVGQHTRDAELAFEDERLNFTYRALLERLSPQDRRHLRTAQRAWLRFRDADCGFGWADRRDCLITRTSEREHQLRSSVYWDARGNPITLEEPARLTD